MGRRRVRCLRQNGVHAVSGFDARADRRAQAAQEYGIEVRDTLAADDLRAFDVVVISTPPDAHHEAIGWSITAGKPCFVEASVIRGLSPSITLPELMLTRPDSCSFSSIRLSCQPFITTPLSL